jgi:hypothetical protein
MLVAQLAIVIQTCQGKTVLLAKRPTLQAALFILKCQPKRFTATPATSCILADMIHDSSQSPRLLYRKKVVAGTATDNLLRGQMGGD